MFGQVLLTNSLVRVGTLCSYQAGNFSEVTNVETLMKEVSKDTSATFIDHIKSLTLTVSIEKDPKIAAPAWQVRAVPPSVQATMKFIERVVLVPIGGTQKVEITVKHLVPDEAAFLDEDGQDKRANDVFLELTRPKLDNEIKTEEAKEARKLKKKGEQTNRAAAGSDDDGEDDVNRVDAEVFAEVTKRLCRHVLK